MRATVRALRMKDLFRHLGYVGNREMVALYRTAVALVVPLQGPTTLPPIEALLLRTPIVTVRLYDVPKQVGAPVLLFDPDNVSTTCPPSPRVWKSRRAAFLSGRSPRAMTPPVPTCTSASPCCGKTSTRST